MLTTNDTIKFYILEFKDWLSNNRPELNKTLRKYGAIKYYLVTISFGIIIFTSHELLTGKSGVTWNLAILILMVFLILYSSRIALFFSGSNSLADLASVKCEVSDRWFKNINQVVGDENILLSDFYVAKSIKLSMKSKFELVSFLRSMMLICDAVIDVRGEDNAPAL
jgi:hypothetical protein